MTDFVYDGSDFWVRLKWRLTNGRVIDEAKVMLVDTGAPFTGISASNVAPELKIKGFCEVRILGCEARGVVLSGGVMSLEIDGETRTCAKPVVYSPCFRNDILGADQIAQLHLMPGLEFRPNITPKPGSGWGLSFEWEPSTTMGGGLGELLLGETLPPGMEPFSQTPRPGLFAMGAPPASQGEYASAAGWRIEQAWPETLAAGQAFEAAVTFTAEADLDFAALTFEPPHGFKVLAGEASRSVLQPRAGQVETVALKLMAPEAAGDHFWSARVRVGHAGGEEVKLVPGRMAVRKAGA